ncbi:phage tail tape measure protein [Aliivibrio sp. S4TY2]|uniref:phage tail tape measure protein n=1 Tax=unclassified Aliivibrio TaxID=2645654 RepID=UPI0023784068|nr:MULTISPECIES: phage tail tape measure protein [unclassified Aliivibrio]MDD9158307.1 phage tail tape measure protein [Aliivibrio sp. S4TY2]MDD9162277.1 phage tail tape measure protein [Aliivibrio sp. S4TY1]MDD9166315.1 phage tail tape measure protein [Aliivibrio sp. S4MY2]MDD9170313.1 phage tail tape measure protein [Aliivibrio sp. S4MY4]MDD9187364.1 phage tail tape measure protein [Aliivibrio sp. S4MY3]
MSNKLVTDIVLNLAGNLSQKAKQYGANMSEFAKKNERAMGIIKKSSEAAGRGIDTLGNRYVGFASTVVAGTAVKNVAAFEAQMTRIGTNAMLSAEQVDMLTASIQGVSNQKDIRVATTDLASGVDELLAKTGDLEFVNDNLENMGLFMQAFGADAQSTAAIFAQFREKGVKSSTDVMNTIDDLYGQFAVGSVNVSDLANVSEKLFSVYQGKGPQAISQMAGLVQLFAKTKGSADESVTSIEAVFSAFQDKKKVEFLDQQGIEVFKKGTKELREPVELLMEILDKAQNDPMKLGDVFDGTAISGLTSLYSEENKNLLMKMTSGTAELGATQKAAATNAATFNSAMSSMNNTFNKIANDKLAQPIQDVADAINSVDSETIDDWLKWGETAVIAIGGIIAAKKGMDFVNTTRDFFGKGGKGGGSGAGGMQDLGAMPVYVVNMGAGGMGGGPVGGGGGPTSNQPKSKTSSLIKSGAASVLSGAILYQAGESIASNAQAFSPFDVRRKSSVDASQLPDNFPVSAGLLDVFDDIKGFFGGSSKSAGAANIGLDIKVSDDRIQVTQSASSPTISINLDNGRN